MIENHYDKKYIEHLDSINEGVLYKSFGHGINHNEKVLFYTYYLGIQYQLDETSFQILLDAAKYHDIGRENDLLDPNHGKRSALMVDKVVNSPIYEKEENLNMLRGIIELHSLNDKMAAKIIKKYHIQDEQLFSILFSILKDADALDRVRLSYGKHRFSALNPSYLRMPISKTLIQVSHELNEVYMKNQELTRGGKNEKSLY